MERRRCIRFESTSAISVSVVKPKGIEVEAAVKNTSRVGLNLFVNRPIKKGQNLELKVDMPSRKNPIKTITKVKWVEKKKDKKGYLIGVEFIEMEDKDLADLLDYIYEEWKSKIPKIKIF